MSIENTFASIGKEVLMAYSFTRPKRKPKPASMLAILSVTLGSTPLRKLILEWISKPLGNEVTGFKFEPALFMKWEE